MDRTPAYVADMIDAARELVTLVKDVSLPLFVSDRLRCLAAEKLFINLGEAARRIPPETTAAIPGVPWQQVVATRNILAHRYERIDHEVLFHTMCNDLPAIVAALENWMAGNAPTPLAPRARN